MQGSCSCAGPSRLTHRNLHGAGNYDAYIRNRAELEENQMKKYKWEQEQIKDMKEYIARFGHGSAKLARQAQSKEKTLEKMVRSQGTQDSWLPPSICQASLEQVQEPWRV